MPRLVLLLVAIQGFPAAAGPPRIVSRMEHSPIVVRLPNRTLGGWVIQRNADHDTLFEILSTDNGRRWTEPRAIHTFTEKAGSWGGPQPLVDRNGEVHLFLLRFSKYTLGNRGEGERPAFDDYRGNRIDIWHTKSNPTRTVWNKPREIWAGYTGALNSALQTRTGRIVLPFSYHVQRNWRNRGKDFAEFTFLGTFNSTVIYSDDHGESFHLSPAPLSVETPDIVSAYGAVEPVAIELKDGRIWNLIRTQRGRFYESFSGDGANWSEPQPSTILNSDSPAGLVRTDDRKLVLVWNNCLRYPYAHGGRQVLHAAISEDEGKTWIGYREVLKDPKRREPPPPGGDFGTAYPFPTAGYDGEILIRSGQGTGRSALVALDPSWLYETSQRSGFAHDLEDWTYFGTKGVERIPHPDKPGRYVMQVARTTPGWPAGAVWNFPNGLSGTLIMRFQTRPGFQGANLALADHYSVPWDKADHLNSLWNVRLDASTAVPGRWHTLQIKWSVPSRTARVSIDGHRLASMPLRQESAGANYFRIRSTASATDPAGILVEYVEASVSRR